jgi:hypothetical protein
VIIPGQTWRRRDGLGLDLEIESVSGTRVYVTLIYRRGEQREVYQRNVGVWAHQITGSYHLVEGPGVKP